MKKNYLQLLIWSFFLLMNVNSFSSENLNNKNTIAAPPSCAASFQYTLGLCPDIYFFDASTASATIVSWAWDFGDGNISNQQNPTHTYAANGSYITCLTIIASDFCTSTFCDTVDITCIQAPTCDANFQYTLGACPSVYFFDGSTASGTVTGWAWDFGDGNVSSQQNPNHTYAANGSYITCLTITTSDNCSSTKCDTVDITCIQAPTCDANFQYTLGLCPDIYFFDGSTASGTVTGWAWDFGDGNNSNVQNPTHTYVANGSYITCLTITTSDNCSSTKCDTVDITCNTVGIEDNSLFDKVSVYPNPAEDLVNLDLGELKNVSLQLFTSTGRLIYSKQNITSSVYQVPLNMEQGIYILELKNGTETKKYKIIKE